jgi:AraC family transcriptional regulator
MKWGARIDVVDEMRVAGLSTVCATATNPQRDAALRRIPRLWDEFFARAHELGLGTSGVYYGVSTPADDNVPPLQMNYLAGMAVPASLTLPDGFTDVWVPEGNYLHFTHEGPAENVDETAHELYERYLPSSGLTQRLAPHLELYDERFEHDSPTCEFDLLVPVR